MERPSDEELVAQYRLAPESSPARQILEELFGRHQARVVAWCSRFVGDRSLAHDLAQDVLAKAYSGLPTFRSDSKFSTWLYVITRNRCRDELRSRDSHPAVASEEELADADYVGENDAIRALDAQDARTILRELMRDTLDETERHVMTLHYGHEMAG